MFVHKYYLKSPGTYLNKILSNDAGLSNRQYVLPCNQA